MHAVTLRWRDEVTQAQIEQVEEELERLVNLMPQLHKSYTFGRDLGQDPAKCKCDTTCARTHSIYMALVRL